MILGPPAWRINFFLDEAPRGKRGTALASPIKGAFPDTDKGEYPLAFTALHTLMRPIESTSRAAKAFLVGFALSIALAAGAARIAPGWVKFHENRLQDFIENGIISGSISTSEDSKLRRHWWTYLTGRPSEGGAANLLNQPTLFQELFPHYPSEMAKDQRLWSDYFSRSFDFDTRLPSLNADQEFVVSLSWMGCLDIIQRYGVDTLVLGNSETFRMVIPAQLALSHSLRQDRILECARNGMSVNAIIETTKQLRSPTGAKPLRNVIVGYSMLWGGKPGTKASPDRVGELSEWEQRERELSALNRLWNRLTILEPRRHFSAPRWESFFPLHFTAKENRGPSRSEASPRLDIRAYFSTGFVFSPSHRSQLSKLVTKAENEHYAALRPSPDHACPDAAAAVDTATSLVEALGAVSQNVYIYRAPVNPLASPHVKLCVIEAAHRALLSRSSPSVKIRWDDWKSYGLEWDDYVVPFNEGNFLFLDATHTNAAGARKVTSKIRAWLEEDSSDLL